MSGSVAVMISCGSREGTKATFSVSMVFAAGSAVSSVSAAVVSVSAEVSAGSAVSAAVVLSVVVVSVFALQPAADQHDERKQKCKTFFH